MSDSDSDSDVVVLVAEEQQQKKHERQESVIGYGRKDDDESDDDDDDGELEIVYPPTHETMKKRPFNTSAANNTLNGTKTNISSNSSNGRSKISETKRRNFHDINDNKNKDTTTKRKAVISSSSSSSLFADMSSSSDDDDEENHHYLLLKQAKEKIATSSKNIKQQKSNNSNNKRKATKTTKTTGTNSSISSDASTASGTATAYVAPKTTTATRKKKTTTTTTTNATEMNHKRRKKQEEREEKRKQIQEQKQYEKEQREMKRKQLKEQREEQKRQQKVARQKQVVENSQLSGKYAHQEIVLLMDTALYHHDELHVIAESMMSEKFLVHPSCQSNNDDNDDNTRRIEEVIPNSIQFIRKDYIQGGAEDALEQYQNHQINLYEHIPYVMLILEAKDFVPLLQRDNNGNNDDTHDVDYDNYPKLELWLQNIIRQWEKTWSTSIVCRGNDNQKRPRFIFLLYRIPEELDQIWINHRSNNDNNGSNRSTSTPSSSSTSASSSFSPPTEWELYDAIQWLLIQYQIDCILCPSTEQVLTNVHKLTRALCESPYWNTPSELECIKKIKSTTAAAASSTNDEIVPLERATDVWVRQLQQIPSISESRARNIIEEYPTIFSLWSTYQQLAIQQELHETDDDKYDNNDNNSKKKKKYEEEAKYLLSTIIQKNNQKSCNKVSQIIYQFLTSNDPNQICF